MDSHHWLAIFALFNTSILVMLSINVSRIRLKERIANGDGGNPILKRAIRAHANAVEHLVVVGLQLLTLVSVAPDAVSWMPLLVGAYTGSRLLHALGALKGRLPLRQIGATGTYIVELVGVAVLGLTLI